LLAVLEDMECHTRTRARWRDARESEFRGFHRIDTQFPIVSLQVRPQVQTG